jgi:hypothetical protein
MSKIHNFRINFEWDHARETNPSMEKNKKTERKRNNEGKGRRLHDVLSPKTGTYGVIVFFLFLSLSF